MNLTLSIDENIVFLARRASESMGKSLNQVIREHLEELAGLRSPDAIVQELEALWADSACEPSTWKWNREELYEGTVIP